MRKKKQEAPGDGGFTGPATSPRLTPEDVQRKEFRLAFRGYNERDVDAFLDHVTEELGAYVDENRRLHEQLEMGSSATPAPPTGGEQDRAGEAARRADDILAAARQEAEQIVADARERADQLDASGASPVTTAAAGLDARSVIAPFLGREREFLQNLGKLVQEHAESVRGMVQAARDGRAGGSEAEPGGAPGSAAKPDAAPAQPLAERSEPITVPEAGSETEPSTPVEQPVSVEGGDPERQRSLRELFWGED